VLPFRNVLRQVNRSAVWLVVSGMICLVTAVPFSAYGEGTPEISTTILSGPEGGGEPFEPSITIDPADTGRMVVGAMYGDQKVRLGRGIWIWRTEDNGNSWVNGRMTPPLVGGKPANWAADVIAGTALDGSTLLTTMAGREDPLNEGLGGVFVTRQTRQDASLSNAAMVLVDRPTESLNLAVIYDKPWMIVDHTRTSPHYGSVYVVGGALKLELPERSWIETPVKRETIEPVSVDLTVSKDGGKTFGGPRKIADLAAAADLAISSTGSLEVVYGSKGSIFHIRSSDGGDSFEAPTQIVASDAAFSISAPMVAARPNGDLMACWSKGLIGGPIGNFLNTELRCVLKRPGGNWGDDGELGLSLPPNTTSLLPRLVGTATAWYVLAYVVHATETQVAIFHSTGASEFTNFATLVSTTALGLEKYCAALNCHYFRDGSFNPGHYIGFAESAGRLAAAYIFPRPDGPLEGSAALFVSIINESP